MDIICKKTFKVNIHSETTTTKKGMILFPTKIQWKRRWQIFKSQ